MILQESESLAGLLASLPKNKLSKILEDLTDDEAQLLEYDWKTWGRANQIEPPGDWQYWMLLAGRGFGKTRCGAEWVRQMVESGRVKRIALVAPTAADARDTMVEGESGILATSPPWNRPVYEPSKRRLTWPNGAVATLYSAEKPDRLRGPQHDAAWCDELAAWKYPDKTWDMLQFGLRLGHNPRAVITTTPRPIPLVKELVKDTSVTITKGTTYANISNLAPSYVARIIKKYEGTRLGRQELNAEILDDNPNALWKRDLIEDGKVAVPPNLVRIVVGVDPAVTSESTSDDTGIVVVGVDEKEQFYVIDDSTIHGTPQEWATQAVAAFHKHKADRIIGEVNNGGDLVEAMLRIVDKNIPFSKVHASRGKQVRAEPISGLYEQGRVHHVGSYPFLEDQMCEWVPGEGKSPDRVDALVWAITELAGYGNDEDYTMLIKTFPR